MMQSTLLRRAKGTMCDGTAGGDNARLSRPDFAGNLPKICKSLTWLGKSPNAQVAARRMVGPHPTARSRVRGPYSGGDLPLALDLGILLGDVALADQLGVVQLLRLASLDRLARRFRLLLDLAGVGEVLLGMVVLACRGTVTFAFIPLDIVLLVGHQMPPGVTVVLPTGGFGGRFRGSGPAQWWRGPSTLRLMREDNRHGGFHDDVPGGAAEDHLPEPALRVGALHHEVGADRLGLVDVEFAGSTSVARRDMAADCGDAVA